LQKCKRARPVWSSLSKSEKGTDGYDTANYNLVVGESLDAKGCAFAQHNEKTRLGPRFFFVFYFVIVVLIIFTGAVRHDWRTAC